MKCTCIAAALLAVLSPSLLRAQTCAGPLDLGLLAGASYSEATAISADGSVVVGYSGFSQQDRAFRWTAASGMQSLGTLFGPYSRASGVSSDGMVVVGWSYGPLGQGGAFRWTAATGMQGLGTVGGVPLSASGVSADGTTVVGSGTNIQGQVRAFRWTAATGMQDLGSLSGGTSSALAVSADGAVVVGEDRDASGQRRAFRWTSATGMQDLGTLAGTDSQANGVNADGSSVVGFAANASGFASAFRWTAATGPQDIGNLPGSVSAVARGVSADGTIVTGFSRNLMNESFAFRWTATTGMQHIAALGAAIDSAVCINLDGTIVAGTSFSPTALNYRAFRTQSSIMGDTYCRPSVANSTGCGGIVLARGNPLLFFGSLDLTATLLPQNSFGFFLTSRTQGFSGGIPNNQGNICLSGSIGRFVGPGQIMNSGASGTFTLNVDLGALPTPTGLVSAMPGETWNFQAWHRDANPGPTSNFTDAVSVTFQ